MFMAIWKGSTILQLTNVIKHLQIHGMILQVVYTPKARFHLPTLPLPSGGASSSEAKRSDGFGAERGA